MPSHDLIQHLRFIVTLLYPEPGADRIDRLREVMKRERAAAHVSGFWYGKPGMQPPTIPKDVRAALAQLPADIEIAFHAS